MIAKMSQFYWRNNVISESEHSSHLKHTRGTRRKEMTTYLKTHWNICYLVIILDYTKIEDTFASD